MQIAQNENHLEAATNHFNEQIAIYGQQILINLVGKIIFVKYISSYFYNNSNNHLCKKKRLIIEGQNKNWNVDIMTLLPCWTTIILNMKHLIFIVNVRK